MLAELRLLATLGIGALFVAAAVSKLLAPASFRAAVLAFQLVPRKAAGYVAAVVPVLELLVGGTLLAGYAVAAALVAAGTLLAGFAAAMILTMAEGRRPDCGCGVGHRRPVSGRLVARNVLLAALAAWTSLHPTAGLRELAATSGPYSSGNGIAALITLLLAVVGVQLALEGRRVVVALRSTRNGGR